MHRVVLPLIILCDDRRSADSLIIIKIPVDGGLEDKTCSVTNGPTTEPEHQDILETCLHNNNNNNNNTNGQEIACSHRHLNQVNGESTVPALDLFIKED